MKIIIINGQGRSGKDTVCKIIQKLNSDVSCISTVDKVKRAGKLLGWTGSKTIEDRQFLHELKMLASKFYNHSFEYVKQMVNDVKSDVLIIHSREPEEIDLFKKTFDCKTLLLIRGEKKTFHNRADDSVFEYDYDYILNNDGTLEDLENKVKIYLETL